MTLDKESLYDYGATGLKSFLDTVNADLFNAFRANLYPICTPYDTTD